MKKPEPVAKQVVCSQCGLDWDKHGDNPTIEKCVEMLKAEVARYGAPWTVYTAPRTTSTSFTPAPNWGLPQ